MSAGSDRIGLIGCGAMGGAMVRGLASAGQTGFVCADAMPDAAAKVAEDVGGRVGSAQDAARCPVAIVAIKPKDAEGAFAAYTSSRGEDGVLISVVAGWDLDRITAITGPIPVVRTMPNLAVRDGAGLIAVATRGLDSAQHRATLELLDPLGTVEELPEAQFAAATALAGSGPGLVALVAEGLEEGGVASGFTRPQARRMVRAVLSGTAALLADELDPAELRHQVSSPGGTTVEGVAVLERGAVRAHMADAVRAAARRAGEL